MPSTDRRLRVVVTPDHAKYIDELIDAGFANNRSQAIMRIIDAHIRINTRGAFAALEDDLL